MARVTILEEAFEELQAALTYYGEISEDLGRRLFAEYTEMLSFVAEYPEAFPIRENGSRRVNLTWFPFYLAFRYDEAEDAVTMIAFGHVARRPGYWRARSADDL